LVTQQKGVRHFYDNFLAQTLILGQVDGPHASFTENRLDPVASIPDGLANPLIVLRITHNAAVADRNRKEPV
jgi:hypothetical protein